MSCFELEVDVLEYGCVVDGEVNIFKAYVSAHPVLGGFCLHLVANDGLGVEDFYDHGTGCQKALKIVQEDAEGFEGIGQCPGQGHKDGEHTGGQLAVNHVDTAHEDGDNGQGLRQKVGYRLEGGAGVGGFQMSVFVAVVLFGEFVLFELLAGKGFDNAVTGDVFLGNGAELGELLPYTDVERSQLFGDTPGQKDQDRGDGYQGQCELEVECHQKDKSHHKGEKCIHGGIGYPSSCVADEVEVVGHAGRQVSCPHVVEEMMVLILKHIVHPVPDGIQHGLAVDLHKNDHEIACPQSKDLDA